MRKKFLTFLIVASAFALGACQEDATMDDITEGIELNQPTTADDDDEGTTNPPPSGS